MEPSRYFLSKNKTRESSQSFQPYNKAPTPSVLSKKQHNKENNSPKSITSNRLYDNIHRNRTFLQACDRQPFIITSTHFLNRKSALASMNNSVYNNQEWKKCDIDIDTYKKELIRKIKQNRELEPHFRQRKLRYEGLKAIEVEGCSQNLLDELKNMSADPEKNSRRRLFQSNFRYNRNSVMTISGARSKKQCLDIAEL